MKHQTFYVMGTSTQGLTVRRDVPGVYTADYEDGLGAGSVSLTVPSDQDRIRLRITLDSDHRLKIEEGRP